MGSGRQVTPYQGTSEELPNAHLSRVMWSWGEDHGMRQMTLAHQAEFQRYSKKTRREQFLEAMDAVMPWAELVALIEPHYPKGEMGRKPVGLDIVLRVYFLQQWFALSDPGVEDALCLPSDWDDGKCFPHVWLGVTCGERKSFKRVDQLRKIPCALRFLSCEPLIEDISNLDLSGIGWVLCGGMSGSLSTKYPMDLRWAASLYDSAQKAGVPFLFKQVSHNKTERGINALGLYLADRQGKTADPTNVDCVRQYPMVELEFSPPEPKGVRLDAAGWGKYRRKLAVNGVDMPRPEVNAECPGSQSISTAGVK